MAGRSDVKTYISYRDADVGFRQVSLLADRLTAHFGDGQVLFRFGDFAPRAAIVDMVTTADVVLALIGPRWDVDDAEDTGVTELQTALDHGIPVIPVLVEGAALPAAKGLPAPLMRLMAGRVDVQTSGAGAGGLIEAIERVARSDQPSPPVRALPFPGTARPDALTSGPEELPTPSRTAFISYRRTVSWSTARLVLRDLKDHGVDTFMDVDDIDNGEFERIILTQIAARAHFIVVLEPGSLDGISTAGDWLRREIAHAIALERNIVPLTCNGFRFSSDIALPEDIARLRSFNAVSVPHDYFDAAMTKLRNRFLQLPETPPVTPAPPATDVTVREKIIRALGGTVPRREGQSKSGW